MPENKVAILTRRRDALGDPGNRIRAVRSGAEYRGRGRGRDMERLSARRLPDAPRPGRLTCAHTFTHTLKLSKGADDRVRIAATTGDGCQARSSPICFIPIFYPRFGGGPHSAKGTGNPFRCMIGAVCIQCDSIRLSL